MLPDNPFSVAALGVIRQEHVAIYATPEPDVRRKRMTALNQFLARNHLAEKWERRCDHGELCTLAATSHPYVLVALVSTSGKSWGGE